MTREDAKDSLFRFIERGMTMKNISFEMAIDKIYDDFESRTCENCKYWYSNTRHKILGSCAINDNFRGACSKDFGCNKFERKTDGDV